MEKSECEARVYRRADIAKMLSVSVGTVDKLVKRGELPQPKRLGQKLSFWPREQIEALLFSENGQE